VSRKLLVNDGRSERQLLLVANLVVGRDPLCDISSDNSLLSRRHAEFVVRGADVLVRDLGSRNGVYVNGARTAEERLHPGDSLRIGHLQLQYVEDATPLTSALAAAAADATAMLAVSPPSSTLSPELPASPPVSSDEEERTKFVPGPARQAVAAPASESAALSTDPGEEEEFTRVVAPPRPPAAVVRADTLIGELDDEHTRLVRPPTVVKAPLDDAEGTRVIRPPQPEASATVMLAAQSVPLSPEDPVSGVINVASRSTAEPAGDAWPAFVFSQLAVLVVVVAVAIGAPFQFGQGKTPLAFGAAVIVVLAATYFTGSRIVNRVRAVATKTESR
jgi:predicted component of type VI protein secretion system